MPLLLVLAAVWGVTFALSRAHMMLQAYTDFQEARVPSRAPPRALRAVRQHPAAGRTSAERAF